MTHDLRAALAALRREEREGAPALPIDDLTARAHRSRARHAATYSAIGVGAVAVLTLGAFAADGLWLNRDDTPVPPASEEPRQTPDRTPTATPTPRPTSTATATATAWEPSWSLCGMPVEELYALETAWDWENETGWWLESTWPYDTVVPVDGLLPLTVSVNGPEVAEVTVQAQLTEVVAVETDYTSGAGWVAGVAAMPPGDLVRGRGTAENAVSLGSIETSFVSCDASPLTGGDGALDTSLTGEVYDVLALADIRPDGAETVTAVGYLGYVGTYPDQGEETGSEGSSWTPLVHESGTLTIGTPLRRGPTTTNFSTWTADVSEDDWCGTAVSTAPLRNDPVPAMTLTATGFRDGDGDELIVQITMTNAWDSPVVWGSLAYPYVSVSSNGRVVAIPYGGNMATFALPRPFQPGESVQLETPLGQFTCSSMGGEPWPAGTYELYAEAYLLGDDTTVTAYSVRTTFTLD